MESGVNYSVSATHKTGEIGLRTNSDERQIKRLPQFLAKLNQRQVMAEDTEDLTGSSVNFFMPHSLS